MAQIRLQVNKLSHTVNVDPNTPLLYVLRDTLELHGPRFGCGLAQCGACSVIVDETAMRSCVTPVSVVQNRSITTLEGLGTPTNPHPLQAAFIEEQAAQCGYCINGMIINAKVLLDKSPNPTEDDIKNGLDPILCRCGAHLRIIRAIQRAAENARHNA